MTRLAQRHVPVRPQHRPRLRGVAAPDADRLDRPLPVPPRRPAHAVGRDLAGLRDARRPGQGALRRLVQPRGLADRRGQRGGRAAGTSRAWSASSRTTTCSPGTSSSRCCRPPQHYGVGIIPWSPLAGGLLGGVLEKTEGGRRNEERNQKRIEKHRPALEAYEAFCRELGHAPGRRRPGLAAAPAGGDRADRRAAHDGAVRGRAARRSRSAWTTPRSPGSTRSSRATSRPPWSTPGERHCSPPRGSADPRPSSSLEGPGRDRLVGRASGRGGSPAAAPRRPASPARGSRPAGRAGRRRPAAPGATARG